MNDDRFSDFSIIDNQLYGASCLEAFVRHFRIEHVSVEILLDHLKKIEAANFNRWERDGALLPLNGRGDPAPSDLIDQVPSEIRQDFFRLVDSVVEIGVVDAYGADSMLPLKFLLKAVAILDVHKVPLPSF